jgi:hypothetical protein
MKRLVLLTALILCACRSTPRPQSPPPIPENLAVRSHATASGTLNAP